MNPATIKYFLTDFHLVYTVQWSQTTFMPKDFHVYELWAFIYGQDGYMIAELRVKHTVR